MHAIIVTGGKQYKVAEGETLFIEKLPAQAGEQVVFDQVLAVLDGENATIGRIFKYNPKKGYRRRQGHRQPYTKVEITKISA